VTRPPAARATSGLTRRRYADFVAEVRELIAAGSPGEAELVAALPGMPLPRRSTVVAALGDARGRAGPAALRRLLGDPAAGTEIRCAALLALAKRDGVRASPELAGHLRDGSPHVRSYALHGLAAVGDDRAWWPVLGRLGRLLDRPAPVDGPDRPPPVARAPALTLPGRYEALTAVAYLARSLNDTRRRELVVLLRRRFDRMRGFERRFLDRHWPGWQPDGPPPGRLAGPDPEPFRAWAREPLFGPAFR
jgi:hypothetical protein